MWWKTPTSKEGLEVMWPPSQGEGGLGLTKLSPMIARQEPSDAVDFHTAFNSRADGYQSPAGSSSGSAVCVAAYD